MKYGFKSLFVSMALVAGGAAHAQAPANPFYAELSVAPIKYQEDGLSLTPWVLRGILGYEAHPNVAFEGMFGFGIREGETNVQYNGYNVNVKGKIDSTFGVFVRPKVALTPNLEVYGRLGFAKTSITATGSVLGYTANLSDSGSDVVYGLGLAFKVTPTVSIVGDYMNYYDKDGIKANGFSVGTRINF